MDQFTSSTGAKKYSVTYCLHVKQFFRVLTQSISPAVQVHSALEVLVPQPVPVWMFDGWLGEDRMSPGVTTVLSIKSTLFSFDTPEFRTMDQRKHPEEPEWKILQPVHGSDI